MIYFIRHGETDYNKDKRFQGHLNIPLNQKGIVQAKIALDCSKSLRIDKIYCSPLKRAVETAKIINSFHNAQIIKDDRIKEINQKYKTIWSAMWAIMIVSITALLAGIFIAAFLIPEGVWQLVTILGICVVFLIPCFYALKLEVSVGAYKCKNCGNEIVPTYKQALNAMHMGTTRYLKCDKCGKRTWCKKVIKK